jgi:hypothetical protein
VNSFILHHFGGEKMKNAHVYKEKLFLQFIQTASVKQRLVLFDTLTKSQILAFKEIVANALKETFPLSSVLRKKLVRHRKLLRRLALKSTSNSQNRKILIKLQDHIIAILIDSTPSLSRIWRKKKKNDSSSLG